MRASTLAIMAAVTATPAAAQDVRSTQVLGEGWVFAKGAEAPATGSSDWVRVSVPHSWNRVGHYTNPGVHPNRPETLDDYQGVGWYRLSFTGPRDLDRKRVYLQFDAASRTAEVWLNGKRLGSHAGGFSRFRLDASAALKPGAANTLLVKVDNTAPDVGTATADVLPLAGDFFVHGGLYRPVSLIVTDDVHLDLLDHGGSGVYATTRSIAGGRATIDVTWRARNDAARPVRVEAIVRLLDAAGAVKAEQRRPMTLAGAANGAASATLDVADPHLWNGVADPYLHRLSVELVASGGRVLDRVEQPFGIREVRIDPERGQFLNVKPLRLHGVGYHQDREGKGWAVSEADIAADVAIMREMGANSIRLTHYQHGQPIHDLADRYGLLVWGEIPLVSRWTMGASTTASDGLRADAAQQLRELIRQNMNHPSVVTWGIANEVDFGKSIPIFITNKDGPAPDPMPLLAELNGIAKAEDPTRPTAIATCCEGRLLGDAEVPITAGAADVSGANRYFGWYYGDPSGLGPHLDALRAARPNQPLSVTEYGAGGATSIHTDNVLGGDVDQRGRNQPEEYESYIHETAWATLSGKPYLWATWLWNSFDFATTRRREGDAIDINTKGLVTYDRAIRKDAWYFYKANWSDAPTVHINGRRYVDRAYPFADVRVYSNAPETELIVGGKSLGTMKNCSQRICVWPKVALADGGNSVVARGRFAGGMTEDRIEWRLSPAAARTIRIDSGALVSGAKGFGSDDFFDGGEAGDVNASTGYGKPPPPKVVTGTDAALVAQTYREGDFGYSVPVPRGRYTVTLTFAEPSMEPGKRRFDVTANGRRVVTGLDVAKEAGGPLKAITRRFTVTVGNQGLDLRFIGRTGKAIVSAVEIAR